MAFENEKNDQLQIKQQIVSAIADDFPHDQRFGPPPNTPLLIF